jgi:hypothetical protein
VNVALSSTWSDLENQGHPPWKNLTFSAGLCNFSFQQRIDNNSNGYSHIFDHGSPEYDDVDVGQLRIQDGGHKTETGKKLLNGSCLRRDFKGCPHIFAHARPLSDTKDTA